MNRTGKILGGVLALSLAAATAVAAEAAKPSMAAEPAKPAVAMPPTPAASVKEHHISEAAAERIAKRQGRIVKEAADAQNEIIAAIVALDAKDTKGAFRNLELADGKLNVVLARDPKLKLVPIDLRANVVDLEASADTVKRIVKETQSALEAGQVQTARSLLMPLVSEMRISTDYLPLDIYPPAIKLATQQIQKSNLHAAELTLSGALNSVVSDDEVIPLAPIKAEDDVMAAERLLKEDAAKNKARAATLLKEAGEHLASANALGYGKYADIQQEISAVRAKVEGGDARPGLFEKLKNFFRSLKP